MFRADDQNDKISTPIKEGAGSIDFLKMKKTEEDKREADLALLSDTEREIDGILKILVDMTRLKQHEKNTAKVANLQALLQALAKKIKEALREKTENSENLEQRPQNAGPAVATHPELQEMGGMEIKHISPEWESKENELDLTGKLLDKAEIENKLKNKLKAKHELLHKAKNQLKSRPVNRLLVKFEQKLKQKPVIKEVLKLREEPRYVQPPPRPRPQGG
jgi:hypothetical protein